MFATNDNWNILSTLKYESFIIFFIKSKLLKHEHFVVKIKCLFSFIHF